MGEETPVEDATLLLFVLRLTTEWWADPEWGADAAAATAAAPVKWAEARWAPAAITALATAAELLLETWVLPIRREVAMPPEPGAGLLERERKRETPSLETKGA